MRYIELEMPVNRAVGKESFFVALRAEATARNFADGSEDQLFWLTRARSNALDAVINCEPKWLEDHLQMTYLHDFTKEKRFDRIFAEAKKAIRIQLIPIQTESKGSLVEQISKRFDAFVVGLPVRRAYSFARSMASMFGSF